MATPIVPARPARSSHSTIAPSLLSEPPKIPPRPNRRLDRSISPQRHSFDRSPFNNPSFLADGSQNGVHEQGFDPAGSNTPQRPPSVSLPSIGQEGNEYASLEDLQNGPPSPQESRNVAGDLPLHAPKASVPSSTAKSRIAGVTRTDSGQAAAAGFGKAESETDEKDGGSSHAKSEHSMHRSISAQSSRPQSMHKEGHEEHGIPEIGLQVPMYPNAGDVQAPTPSANAQHRSSGIGFFNTGSQPGERHHGRRRSGRDVFHGPPGSYGLHGHGQHEPRDPFEKAWYDKHPEELERESQGEYGPRLSANRAEWALSSDDLNKLVNKSALSGIGMGTSKAAIATPDEQIGYIASEEYASRIGSSRPPSAGAIKPHHTGSQLHAESPLRKASFPAEDISLAPRPRIHDSAGESEAEEDIIHVDPPSRRGSKIHGMMFDLPVIDDTPKDAEEGDLAEELGYGAPILASDEVAKHPEAEYMQPAVPPESERMSANFLAGVESTTPSLYQSARKSNSRPGSRPSSRPSSMHGAPISRLVSLEEPDLASTPLEEIEEYEPLFPENEKDEEKSPDKERPMSAVEKLKRPDHFERRFPSQDIWEDTPVSLQLQATVKTPQAPQDDAAAGTAKAPVKVFEPPQAEAARQNEVSQEDRANFLTESTKQFADPNFKPDVGNDIRPRHLSSARFPSQDIWEDTPDYHRLVTTVKTPQTEDPMVSPPEIRPTTGAVAFSQDKAARGAELKEGEDRATTGISATLDKPDTKPMIPARPVRARPPPPAQATEASPTERKAPSLPDKAKPRVPARPAKTLSNETADAESHAKVSLTPAEGAVPPAPKIKPAVPARPGGGKIAALKAGFMQDLNSRLQLGPQLPKSEEPAKDEAVAEEPKAPLNDARRGRAKGPARRKPGSSTAAAADENSTSAPALGLSMPFTLWHLGADGVVEVPDVFQEGAAKEPMEVTADESALANGSEPDSQEVQSATGDDLGPAASGSKSDTTAEAIEPTSTDASERAVNEASSEGEKPNAAPHIAAEDAKVTDEMVEDTKGGKVDDEGSLKAETAN